MMDQEIIIDPFLLCLPNPCDSLSQLEDFISALAGWHGFLDRADTCVLLSDSARVALLTDGEFPHRHKLAELINKFDCTIADANTVLKIANSILDRTPALEDYFGINAILIEEDSFEIVPAMILNRLKTNCQVAFKDDLLIASIKDKEECLSINSESQLVVASGSLVEENELPTAISIKADIHDVGIISSESNRKWALPISLSHSLPISFGHEQLIASLDLWVLWDKASSAEAVRLCIESCINNLISTGTDSDKNCAFVIGNSFVASLRKWGANTRRDYAMITVESCARIALGIPKNTINEFRESSDVSAKQHTRVDGALAFRTHLTKKGVGLRLMFWKHTDGTIEFANIGGKDELNIL